MEGSLDAVLKSMGEPSGGSYLRFLYAIQQRDYQACLEHLHRYIPCVGSTRFVCFFFSLFHLLVPLPYLNVSRENHW